MTTERVTDTRLCPTCGHCHLNGIGAGWCTCGDCSLLWTPTPRHALAPEYRDRLEKLERGAGRLGDDAA